MMQKHHQTSPPIDLPWEVCVLFYFAFAGAMGHVAFITYVALRWFL